ncbi:hypothetical protein CDV57_06081, partial [Aspergillus fumigatus]
EGGHKGRGQGEENGKAEESSHFLQSCIQGRAYADLKTAISTEEPMGIQSVTHNPKEKHQAESLDDAPRGHNGISMHGGSPRQDPGGGAKSLGSRTLRATSTTPDHFAPGI